MALTSVLLESGTNEIEIMKFMVNGELYGINVAKIKEIMISEKVKPVPYSHKAVEGIFKPRETIFTVIDLPYYLSGIEKERDPRDLFMVSTFNQINVAFRVNSVIDIQRMSWQDIEKPDITLSGEADGVATGIVKKGDELIIILDFEKILSDIAPETTIDIEEVENVSATVSRSQNIFIAEDSTLLRRMLIESLQRAGYNNVTTFNNGEELWNHINKYKTKDELMMAVDLVITDIEMPKMDGHRLTKLIKDDALYKQLPVLIFSSLISNEMRKKGEEIGADGQLSKPEIGKLIGLVNQFVGNN